jgi:hypothetical protein
VGKTTEKPRVRHAAAAIKLRASALADGGLGRGHIEVAFSEVERNFIERALLPLFRPRQPEDLALGIPQGALPAKKFLVANFNKPLHELHSLGVKPICLARIADSGMDGLSGFSGQKRQLCCLILSLPLSSVLSAQ